MNDTASPYIPDPQVSIDGVRVNVRRAGQGRPLVFLTGLEGWIRDDAWFPALAEHFDVIVPAHPGFGLSELPREIASVGDLALFYLSFLERLDLRDVVLVGSSFGGWVAAELAVRSTARISKLVLVDALGVKHGGRDDRDIADIYAMSQAEVAALFYKNPEQNRRDVTKMPDHVLRSIARSRETLAMLGWKPYMHNPTLKAWLRRIDVPTQVIWGDSDGLVSPQYGRRTTEAIPGARFHQVADAGHYPHLEQPAAFVAKLLEFDRQTQSLARKAA